MAFFDREVFFLVHRDNSRMGSIRHFGIAEKICLKLTSLMRLSRNLCKSRSQVKRCHIVVGNYCSLHSTVQSTTAWGKLCHLDQSHVRVIRRVINVVSSRITTTKNEVVDFAEVVIENGSYNRLTWQLYEQVY
jgi:predicted nucleic acid-binding Zn finger protein